VKSGTENIVDALQRSVAVVVGLGANLGEPRAAVDEAIRQLEALSPIVRRSSLWRTAPIGGPSQPDYVNAAVLLRCSKPPLALLTELLAIEARLGRVRTMENGPRTIDLDILWIEGVVVDEPTLVVPHPRLAVRAFAIGPLLEVVPDARDPRTNQPYLMPTDQRVERWIEG
jgi:2-amino-4-hydroxy-6-hydroxymethyldihydropteridine diphosphokinase